MDFSEFYSGPANGSGNGPRPVMTAVLTAGRCAEVRAVCHSCFRMGVCARPVRGQTVDSGCTLCGVPATVRQTGTGNRRRITVECGGMTVRYDAPSAGTVTGVLL